MRLSRPQNLALQLQPGWPSPRTIIALRLLALTTRHHPVWEIFKHGPGRIGLFTVWIASPWAHQKALWRILLFVEQIDSPSRNIGIDWFIPPAVANRGVDTRRESHIWHIYRGIASLYDPSIIFDFFFHSYLSTPYVSRRISTFSCETLNESRPWYIAA